MTAKVVSLVFPTSMNKTCMVNATYRPQIKNSRDHTTAHTLSSSSKNLTQPAIHKRPSHQNPPRHMKLAMNNYASTAVFLIVDCTLVLLAVARYFNSLPGSENRVHLEAAGPDRKPPF